MADSFRFIVDECTGSRVAAWLAEEGYEVYSVYDESPGITDLEIIAKAYKEDWIIVTNDKDFGELIFRDAHPHKGVIFLRLANERSVNKIYCIRNLLEKYKSQIKNRFVVVSETSIRISNNRDL